MPPPSLTARYICASASSSGAICSSTSNAPTTSNSSANGILQASIWKSSTPGRRTAAYSRPSVKISLPENECVGNAVRNPASTNPVPQPISNREVESGKYRRSAQISSRLRDRNQKLSASSRASLAKCSALKPDPDLARSGENVRCPPTRTGVYPQVGHVQLWPAEAVLHARQIFIALGCAFHRGKSLANQTTYERCSTRNPA